MRGWGSYITLTSNANSLTNISFSCTTITNETFVTPGIKNIKSLIKHELDIKYFHTSSMLVKDVTMSSQHQLLDCRWPSTDSVQHVQFQLQPVSLWSWWCHGWKSFFHTSMFMQTVRKPYNCTSFMGRAVPFRILALSLKMVSNWQSVIMSIKFSWKLPMIFTSEKKSILNGEMIHWLAPSGSLVKNSKYERNCSNRFYKCCIMLAWVPAKGLLLSRLSGNSLNVANAAKFLVSIHPCHRNSILWMVCNLSSTENMLFPLPWRLNLSHLTLKIYL